MRSAANFEVEGLRIFEDESGRILILTQNMSSVARKSKSFLVLLSRPEGYSMFLAFGAQHQGCKIVNAMSAFRAKIMRGGPCFSVAVESTFLLSYSDIRMYIDV